VLKAENQQVVRPFLERHDDARDCTSERVQKWDSRRVEDGPGYQRWTGDAAMDGFYLCLSREAPLSVVNDPEPAHTTGPLAAPHVARAALALLLLCATMAPASAQTRCGSRAQR
jgi:hypothetical protein